MSNSFFNEKTGTTDRERQSWRDSYNGGRAAGDITGNVNRQLDAERSAFGGATWSGSSSKPSALQLAAAMPVGHPAAAIGGKAGGAGPASGAVTYGGADSAGSGPANSVVVQGARGGSLTLSGPLSTKIKMSATGGYAGIPVLPNPFFSDVQDFWEARYGEPGEWIGGLVNFGADGAFAAARFADWATGSRIVTGPRRKSQVLTELAGGPGAWPSIKQALDDFDQNGAARIDQWFVDTFAPEMGANGGGW